MDKIVVKVGTSTLTQGTSKLSRRFMLRLVEQLAELQAEGKQLILVSSGAIAAGRELLPTTSSNRSLPFKQMYAAVGQANLMHVWSELFALFDMHVAQILLTREDFSNRKRYLNARDTLTCLLNHRIIPIINENDTVATQEIRVGDNDNLAALVANLVAADALILLTDQKGLYTADPRLNPEAQLIPIVEKIDDTVFALAGASSTKLGTGGMVTKIEAAQTAARSGTRTIIASSALPHVLQDIVAGKQVGTLFMEEMSRRESRKRWLLSEKKQGTIRVDEGAAAKISHDGASLLASGIIHVSGEFDRGATIHILSSSSEEIAVGITNYASSEISLLLGKHSGCIEEILGYTYGDEIIHRSNMTRISFNKDKRE